MSDQEENNDKAEVRQWSTDGRSGLEGDEASPFEESESEDIENNVYRLVT